LNGREFKMSDQDSREKRSKRFHDDDTKVKKHSRVYKQLVKGIDMNNHDYIKQPHRLHKRSGMNCGNHNCMLCSNPRKIFHEITRQEQSFYQDKLWSDDESKVI
jgi:hypothetical protein